MEPTKATHHPNCGTNVIPYKVGSHRHTPEIQMALGMLSGRETEVVFTPHLVPIVRGILCTSYVHLNKSASHDDLYSVYEKYYSGKRFIRVDSVPSIPSIVGSNFCEIGYEFAGNGNVVVMSTVDNLMKGGAGQAVQNANVMFGIDESAGLDFPGLGV
jgi:N-acetyl-gamma-glutamyl-phosphate reductase